MTIFNIIEKVEAGRTVILSKPTRTMLLIDDDASILRVFKRIFEKKGYSVATAESGKEAEAKLAENSFDATLLDLKLPDMNGVDLLPLMQKTAPDMVRIVITGLSNEENALEAEEKGADAFLPKPVKPEILLDVLERKFKEKNIYKLDLLITTL